MRRLIVVATLVLWAGAQGCAWKIEELDCKVDRDCPQGYCDQGVCVVGAPPADAGGSIVLPEDARLSLVAPKSPVLSPAVEARVELARPDGTRVDHDGKVTLSVTRTAPVAGDAEVLELTRAEPGVWTRELAFDLEGTYTLEATLEGTALAPVVETIEVALCTTPCGATRECHSGVCKDLFDVAIDAPAGGTFPQDILVRVERAYPNPYRLPEAVQFVATLLAQPVFTATLSRGTSSDADRAEYRGKWADEGTDRSGAFEVKVQLSYPGATTPLEQTVVKTVVVRPTVALHVPGAPYLRGRPERILVTSDVTNLSSASLVVGDGLGHEVKVHASGVHDCRSMPATVPCPCVAATAGQGAVRACLVFPFDFAGLADNRPVLGLDGVDGKFKASGSATDSEGSTATVPPAELPVTRLVGTYTPPVGKLPSASPILTPMVVLPDGKILFGASTSATLANPVGHVLIYDPVGKSWDKRAFAGEITLVSAVSLQKVALLRKLPGGKGSVDWYDFSLSSPLPNALGLSPKPGVAVTWIGDLPVAVYTDSSGLVFIRRSDQTSGQKIWTGCPLPEDPRFAITSAKGVVTVGCSDGAVTTVSLSPSGIWTPTRVATGLASPVVSLAATSETSLALGLGGEGSPAAILGLTPPAAPVTLHRLDDGLVPGALTVVQSRILAFFRPAPVPAQAYDTRARAVTLDGTDTLNGTLPASSVLGPGPVLGAGGNGYLAARSTEPLAAAFDAKSLVVVGAADPIATAKVWEASAAIATMPALDCVRVPAIAAVASSVFGSLYTLSPAGALTEYVVDDPGLAPTPWPQPGHDGMLTSQLERARVACTP